MKTSELTGPALDWAVAKCEGLGAAQLKANGPVHVFRTVGYEPTSYEPSQKWSQGGPIIEREDMEFILAKQGGHHESAKWMAVINNSWFGFGENHLIAAMRAFVSSKLGAEVDIPEELL